MLRPKPMLFLLLVGLMTCGLLFSATRASADSTDDGVRYAAIALDDSNGNYGYAYNYTSREKAEQAAIRRAGGNSRIILSTTSSFFAFAQAPLGGWGTGTGDTPEEAKNRALSNAKKHSVFPEIKFCEYNGAHR